MAHKQCGDTMTCRGGQKSFTLAKNSIFRY